MLHSDLSAAHVTLAVVPMKHICTLPHGKGLTFALVMAACSKVTLMVALGLMPLMGLVLLISAPGCHITARDSLKTGASTAPMLRLKPVPRPSWPISLTLLAYACCMYNGRIQKQQALGSE